MKKAPYGYRVDATGRLVPHATEQAVIALVRKARGDGFTVREITAQLEAAGLVSRRDSKAEAKGSDK